MSFFSLVRYGVWRMLEIVCSKCHIYAFIKTQSGIKNINMSALYDERTYDYKDNDIINVDPRNLFLSIDYLNDNYTLIDTCIVESPHYRFIKAINTGIDITKTDYYKRFISGKLDGRHCQRERGLDYFYEKNENIKLTIENDDYKPVIVYYYHNRLYIYDGKHRAAFCAFMNKSVRCVKIPSISDFGHMAINKEIYRIMSENKHYSKHVRFLDNEEK